jgi:TldD protein
VLVEGGTVAGVLTDLSCARTMAAARGSGNARRLSYTHPVAPRMTATIMMGGTADETSIVADTRSGLLVETIANARVDPVSGNFTIQVSEARLISGGVPGPVVTDVILTGQCLDALRRVDAVGAHVGVRHQFCNKGGQRLPITVGSPAFRIAELEVGTRS